MSSWDLGQILRFEHQHLFDLLEEEDPSLIGSYICDPRLIKEDSPFFHILHLGRWRGVPNLLNSRKAVASSTVRLGKWTCHRAGGRKPNGTLDQVREPVRVDCVDGFAFPRETCH